MRGAVVDRVAAGGELGLVHPAPALAKQFPLKCDLGRKVAGAEGSRVAAFKVRPGRGGGGGGVLHTGHWNGGSGLGCLVGLPASHLCSAACAV